MSRPLETIFKAFADETRLRILHVLAHERELCVCDLMSVLRLPQSKASRHLAYLRGAGLVSHRKDGQWAHYSLAKPAGAVHKSLIACLGGCFRDITALRRDLASLRRFNGRAGARCS